MSANKPKAPFKRGQALTLTDTLVNGGRPTPCKYVKWMGLERAALIIVSLIDASCACPGSTPTRRIVHVKDVVVAS